MGWKSVEAETAPLANDCVLLWTGRELRASLLSGGGSREGAGVGAVGNVDDVAQQPANHKADSLGRRIMKQVRRAHGHFDQSVSQINRPQSNRSHKLVGLRSIGLLTAREWRWQMDGGEASCWCPRM